MATTCSTAFHSCDSHMSNMTSSLKSNYWWEDNHNDDNGPPRVVLIHQMQHHGGLLSDTLVDDDELQNLDLEVISILTDDQTAVPQETLNEKQQQHQGVNRVVEALRSIQIRRQSGDKESSGRAESAPRDTLVKATRQERFSRQSKTQNSGIAQTTPALKREKSFLLTPDTLGSNTPGNKSKKEDSDAKGIASLRRFLSFPKKAQPSLFEPGLASMGEEDTVQ
mmetsp:Transcript_10898/g.19756  ORF Transcript_10898/g.19756 Transcript_10898/m.19756 type:complete len:223 (+) Transcript_10898:494-1162(+)